MSRIKLKAVLLSAIAVWVGLFVFVDYVCNSLQNYSWYTVSGAVVFYFWFGSIIFYIFGYTVSKVFNLQQHYK